MSPSPQAIRAAIPSGRFPNENASYWAGTAARSKAAAIKARV
jgi:hypothetical protein